jgi:hypothetical protein
LVRGRKVTDSAKRKLGVLGGQWAGTGPRVEEKSRVRVRVRVCVRGRVPVRGRARGRGRGRGRGPGRGPGRGRGGMGRERRREGGRPRHCLALASRFCQVKLCMRHISSRLSGSAAVWLTR